MNNMKSIVKIVVAALIFGCSIHSATAQTAEEMFELGSNAFYSEDYDKAMEWWLKAADAGNADAMYGVAVLYGNRRDYAQALQWYAKAADKGQVAAIYETGVLFAHALGVKQDYALAFQLWQRAAIEGYVDAMYGLGVLYANGLGCDVDFARALDWLTKADAAGHPQAKETLEQIEEFLRQSPDKQMNAEYIEGVRAFDNKDYAKAAQLWEKAAAVGSVDAMYGLGALYFAYGDIVRGAGEGDKNFKQDVATGIQWYTKAANAGHLKAMAELAHIYSFGVGIEINEQKANEWIEKVREANEKR